MTALLLPLLIYCVLIVLASLLGGRLPTLIELDHRRMQMLISGVAGLMLGIAIFHLLPHAIAHLGASQIDLVTRSLMLGLLVMFFLLRTFHFHHHDPDQIPHEHHNCGHDHDHDSGTTGPDLHDRSLAADMSWMGVFLGLSFHTLIDGLALGASVQSDSLHPQWTWTLGLATFLAIVLHKPLDAMSITTLMRASHWPVATQNLVNVSFAAMCPLGAVAFVLLGTTVLSEQQNSVVGSMLAFSAGVFLCISLSDLLPEMEFHSHHRVSLTVCLLCGIGLAWGIGLIEPKTAHLNVPSEQGEKTLRFDFGRPLTR